ncbi:hypothetical protein SELMODRAFT_229823 [Selaginella moellendorffii]|uniref:Uncharacterized protein n=1 Tax=Selaginella moellendorffii TaxID=88036 RepID=D8QPH8_SELML|nr:hypothetical protein SELMODRAFT_229823 [Selaginella moellendorffii]
MATAPLLCCAPSARLDLSGKRVVVVGLGSSGRAAIRLALLRGASVIAVDKNDKLAPLKEDPAFHGYEMDRVSTELGPHQLETFLSASRIVVSPGVPLSEPILAYAMDSGIPTISELGFAAEAFPKAVKIAAVTGTNGKSTVTTFTGQILQQAGVRTFVGGNLGTPFSDAACECFKFPSDDPPYQAAVLEVSSYQLELPGSFSPSVGVILNLSPDHLERHKSMENYGETKCRLFERMDSSKLSIIPHADEFLRKVAYKYNSGSTKAWLGALPGVQLDSQARRAVVVVPTTKAEARLYLSGLKAVGSHNAQNAATASLLSLALDVGVDEHKLQAAIGQLTPLPHRMQIVGQDKKGVLWINDSKATNVDAAYTGIKGLADRKAVILLGGLAKVLDEDGSLGFKKLSDLLQNHRAIVTFGAFGEQIEKELKEANVSIPCFRSLTMEDAVARAEKLSKQGDIILLSPACASFDEFRNFQHRGEVFGQLATRYITSTT